MIDQRLNLSSSSGCTGAGILTVRGSLQAFAASFNKKYVCEDKLSGRRFVNHWFETNSNVHHRLGSEAKGNSGPMLRHCKPYSESFNA